MGREQIVSTREAVASFQKNVISVSGELNGLSNAGSSQFSYTTGSLSANKMVQVASKVDAELLRFMSSYIHDTESFMNIADNFVQLDEQLASAAGKISG